MYVRTTNWPNARFETMKYTSSISSDFALLGLMSFLIVASMSFLLPVQSLILLAAVRVTEFVEPIMPYWFYEEARKIPATVVVCVWYACAVTRR